MEKEEYIRRVEEDDGWAPGWDAIEDRFIAVYSDQEPSHYGTTITNRAMFGGDQYLDGYSIYRSDKGYVHIVTFGMSELYGNEEAFEGEYSKWGYEMTMKLRVETDEECMWALDMLSNLARYTYTSNRFVEPFQYISGGGNPIRIGADTKLTGLIVVEDTEIKGADTVHGRLDFLQMVGITQSELDALIADPDQAVPLVERMKADNPMLITDLGRTHDYL